MAAVFPVGLHRCNRYDRAEIVACIELSMEHLGRKESYHGKKILLKPNLISGSGPRFACTHPEFIAGAAIWFLDHGARVVLGDSPAFGSASSVCEKMGIFEAIRGLDVQVIDFSTPLKVELCRGAQLTVAKEALSCDIFVGLPKIKAHNQMFVTMAVKNIFGIVKGVQKGWMHMVHGHSHDKFSELILDLQSLLPVQLHFADGIEVMHQSGPLDGSPLGLHCLAVAESPVALDTALLELLSLDAGKSPLWRIAARRGRRDSEKSNLYFPLLTPKDFTGSGFVAPETLNQIRFNPFRFLNSLVKRMVLHRPT